MSPVDGFTLSPDTPEEIADGHLGQDFEARLRVGIGRQHHLDGRSCASRPNGSQAADVEGADLAHTVMGYATHHAATIFWAFLFEEWLERRPARDAAGLVGDALLMSAVAAVVNYGATPKRFTPGWEFVLSRGAMAAAYGAMAVGLAVGSAIAPRHPNHRSI